MKKVLVTARIFGHISDTAYDPFKNRGYAVVDNPYKGKALSEEELMELIPGVHGLLTGVDKVTGRFIEAAADLKVISKFGAGVDNIDVAAATQRGIVVTRAPAMNSESVADMAFALLLAVARRVVHANDRVKSGDWPLLIGTEIWGKTLGIIGLGQIGKRVALRAKGFSMRVLGYETAPDAAFCAEHGIELVDLDRLLGMSDFITIHVPLTDESRDLIGKRELDGMKPGAYLVNTARGGIVNEDALYEALTAGRIGGAAFDVLKDEPPIDRKLIGLDNFIVTPHMAAFTKEAISNMERLSAQNLIDVIEGRVPEHIVNPEVLKRP